MYKTSTLAVVVFIALLVGVLIGFYFGYAAPAMSDTEVKQFPESF